MKKHFLLTLLLTNTLFAQDTFSIVAVDTLTGEIGSAGASCVGPINGVGAYILSDVLEGIGAIHTQASYSATNQQTARQRMLLGDSPQEIIDYMITHDVSGNPTIRQYGIVDLRRRGESAAYTGVNCINYKNHETGQGWAVQGNILSGQLIIDTIKNTFLATPGPLADRMMTALEAAMIIGADTRCASRGTSSQSAFIKIVRIGDGNRPYLLKIIPDSPPNVDPIGLLRQQFNLWKDSLRTRPDPFLSRVFLDQDTLPANGTSQATLTIIPKNNSDTLLPSGLSVLIAHTGSGTVGTVTDSGNGTYTTTVTAPSSAGTDTFTVRVVSGTDTVRLATRPVLHYTAVTSVEHWTTTPSGFALEQSYPNPFNPSTTFSFGIPQSSFVILKVYDLLGREIATLVNRELSPGRHQVTWDASGFASGVYYYRLIAGSFTDTKKLILYK
jgi:uncharacterized Ntn-hydrolase superfamily protein